MTGAWLLTRCGHVIPIDDLKPHLETADCWCHPTDDEGVMVHHSLDKREDYETGATKPS